MNRWIKALTTALLFGVLAGCGGDDDPAPIPQGTTPEVTLPAAPASLSVEPGDQTNTVQWPAVAAATSYTLYWSETSPLTKATATAIPNAVSPYKHTGLTNGKLLYYAVAARSAAGEGDLSNTVGATPVAPIPAAPASLSATAGNSTVTIAWGAVSGADSYTVYWSKATGLVPGATGVTKVAGLTGTSYAHTGLTNGEAYFYIVAAVNTGGESAASREASATPLPPAPGAPSNLAATSGDTKIQLAWSPAQDALSYNVYWSKAAGIVAGAAGVTKISALTATSYSHEGLTNGETYYYAVSAVGMGGESALSAEKSVMPLPPAPPAPLGVTAISAKDAAEVAVQWFDVPNYPSAAAPIQLGYNLYRGLQPGVATYLNDPTKVTKFANVTAPYIDLAVTKSTTYYYVVTAFVPALPMVESVASGEVSAAVGNAGGGGGGGEGGDEGFASNLSFPLVFADGYGLTGLPITGVWPGIGPFATVPTFDFNTGLRPLSAQVLSAFPYFDSATAVAIAGVTYYPQGTASTWQAEWRNNAAGNPLEVIVDWGDALLSKSYTASSMIRIETTLKQDATIAGVTDTMTAYKMMLLSGSGITELQGTDKSTYASATRNVFAINARLKVEKLAADGTTVESVLYDKAVYQGFGTTVEGGGRTNDTAYGAELNQGGLIVYGKNFYMSQVTGVQKTGQYRITFSLDPNATLAGNVTVPNHIKMVNKSDAGATLATDGLSSSVVITVN